MLILRCLKFAHIHHKWECISLSLDSDISCQKDGLLEYSHTQIKLKALPDFKKQELKRNCIFMNFRPITAGSFSINPVTLTINTLKALYETVQFYKNERIRENYLPGFSAASYCEAYKKWDFEDIKNGLDNYLRYLLNQRNWSDLPNTIADKTKKVSPKAELQMRKMKAVISARKAIQDATTEDDLTRIIKNFHNEFSNSNTWGGRLPLKPDEFFFFLKDTSEINIENTFYDDIKEWKSRIYKKASGEMKNNIDKAADRIEACFKQRLTTLDLRDLQLTSLPPVFERLIHVDTLNLSGNRLKKLNLENMDALIVLDISHNRIKKLTLSDLPLLYAVDIRGNEIDKITIFNTNVGKRVNYLAVDAGYMNGPIYNPLPPDFMNKIANTNCRFYIKKYDEEAFDQSLINYNVYYKHREHIHPDNDFPGLQELDITAFIRGVDQWAEKAMADGVPKNKVRTAALRIKAAWVIREDYHKTVSDLQLPQEQLQALQTLWNSIANNKH